MKTGFRCLLAAAMIAAGAVSAFALSEQYVQFGKGPAQFFMMKEELAKWNSVKDDAEAQAFIVRFWARRGANFRTEFERAVKMADDRFKEGSKRGSTTARGRIFLLFGAPSRIVTQAEGAQAQQPQPGEEGVAEIGQARQSGPKRQVWTYEKDRATVAFGVENRVDILFMDRLGNGEYTLQRPPIDLDAAQQRRVEAMMAVPPQAGPPPTAQAPKPVAPMQPATPAATPTDLKTAALQAAVDELKGGKSTLNKNAVVSYAEFVSPMGEYFVPVQLFVPKAAGLAADDADTFFVVVEDASGKRVAAFEEPAKLTATKNDFFVDKALTSLTAGKYTVEAGLAKGGQPVLVVSTPMELNPSGKDDVGVSKLLLLDNVIETSEAAPMKAPFAFGKLKLIPKANLTFTNKDEIGYFVEVHNPGLDPSTNLPKLQMRLDLIGNGKTITAPLSEVQALPLSGAVGPGQYAIVNTIPLAQLSKPLDKGDYTLKMKIVDTVSQKSYTLEQKFKIAG